MTLPIWTIFYDGQCAFCIRGKESLKGMLPPGGSTSVDMNDLETVKHYPMIDANRFRGQMWILSPEGELAGGYDGLAMVAGSLPGWKMLAPMMKWRPVRWMGLRVYKWIAAHRYVFSRKARCDSGACSIQRT